jgi:hypothetical protein
MSFEIDYQKRRVLRVKDEIGDVVAACMINDLLDAINTGHNNLLLTSVSKPIVTQALEEFVERALDRIEQSQSLVSFINPAQTP